ncbi:MAG: aminotransferase class I/II-fold pyridoxal phosphate-dependent enzyme, partial [Phycisphaeraceae bacterium]|nr:aminotransferase class I/II-fold pyridoxal phosphate-dependent enzyme [Phycisphaeraceae bacterium]
AGVVDGFNRAYRLDVGYRIAHHGEKTVPPSGAFYAFPDVSRCFGLTSPGGRTIDSAGAFAEALLEEKEVAVVPGDDFGDVARTHIRLSFACGEEQIRAGVGRIREWVDALA